MNSIGETTLELNLNALEYNYNYLKAKIAPETQFLAVVKGFAYGSDQVAVAQKLESLGVDYFGVTAVQEGALLRNAGITTPILVLHPLMAHLEELIRYHLEPNLYSPKILHAFLSLARERKQREYPVHIKFNTGFNRLGFGAQQVDEIGTRLKDNSVLKVASVVSHLAASEDLGEREFTQNQIAMFQLISKRFTQHLGYAPRRQLLNTSGILNYPEAQFEMVRSGIGLYGYGNDARFSADLRPIATLKTLISQIQYLNPRDSVGYNRAYKAPEAKTIAILPLGYADGIGRHYGKGKAHVLIHGKKAPIIGNVCMDMLMVDVTGMDCREGDEVVVFGPGHSAEAFANQALTISYEVLTGISPRVKRVHIED